MGERSLSPPDPVVTRINGKTMNNALKNGIIVGAAAAAMALTAAMADAQTVNGTTAGTNVLVIPQGTTAASLSTTAYPSSPYYANGYYFGNGYYNGMNNGVNGTGYYNNGSTAFSYPMGYVYGYYNTGTTASGIPGAPNTGGPIVASNTTYPSNATIPYNNGSLYSNGTTYAQQSAPNGTTLYNNGYGFGVSPAYAGTAYAGSYNGSAYIAPNGTPVQMTAGGLAHVSGMVTTVTPSAFTISSNNQTWTIRWTNGTAVLGNSSLGANGTRIAVGDMIEVDGYIDPTYASQIDATMIRDLSLGV